MRIAHTIPAIRAAVAELTDKANADEAAERKRLVDGRPDLPKALAAIVLDPKTPIETARAIVDALPGLETKEAAQLHRMMGIRPGELAAAGYKAPPAPRRHFDAAGFLVLPTETPGQARARLASPAPVR